MKHNHEDIVISSGEILLSKYQQEQVFVHLKEINKNNGEIKDITPPMKYIGTNRSNWYVYKPIFFFVLVCLFLLIINLLVW